MHKIKSRPFKIDKPMVLILIIWTFVNWYLLFKNGIVITGEAEKYILEANILLRDGKLSSPNHWMYFTQILLLSFSLKLKLGFAFNVGIQLALNLLATAAFYQTIKFLVADNRIACAGTVILLLNQPYQEFNTFLQTESLFYSFSILYTWYLLTTRIWSITRIIGLLFFLALLMFTRPAGLLYIPLGFIYLFFAFKGQIAWKWRLIIVGFSGLLFLIILNMALGSGGELDIMLPFRQDSIICGVPSLNGNVDIQSAQNANSVFGLIYYVFHNMPQFIRLSWHKTIAFFGLFRTYYSPGHNMYLMGYFYCMYIFAILGISYWKRQHPYQTLYFITIIALTWATVLLTCDDWHNRFFLSISPFLIILSMGFVKRWSNPPKSR